MNRPDGAAAAPESDAGAPLAGLLLEATQALAQAGRVEEACRIAGRACAALRLSHPADHRRFNVLLHRLTPKLDW